MTTPERKRPRLKPGPKTPREKKELLAAAPSPLRLNAGQRGKSAPNPMGIGGWKPGESGNPIGVSRMYALNDLRQLMRTYTRPAVATVINIMRDKGQSGAVRLEAAKYILNQGWGAPIQAHSNADGSNINILALGDQELVRELERARAIEAAAVDITPTGGS